MKEFYLEKLFFDIQCPRPVKMIRATQKFVNYISVRCRSNVWYKNSEDGGYVTYLAGIPLVVDDTILSKYYELEF